ncbi:exodeoxyribonuclease V subunit alpha [Hahella sp. CCB-MM4]|uniref:exodeoxyribonuclease V subunit alpha n=1 Tax=Hahella sp. (strain CCB-MM4) TaxID=1926491 RepID=UPI000B9BE29C|nr:exodeoxyribonuclease V subunit alpha [Hahella sp. CCB-MM4]OZG74668.1 exodeoxyribonuclease V subunit alpha [Hahella sp. CCB-MM4]
MTAPFIPLIDLASAAGILRPLDRALGLMVADLESGHRTEGLTQEERGLLALTTAQVSQSLTQGHLCLDLSQLAGKPIWPGNQRLQQWLQDNHHSWPVWPPLESWLDFLQGCRQVAEAGSISSPDDISAVGLLCLDERHRLYLSRYYEAELALAIHFNRLQQTRCDLDQVKARELLQRYFADTNGQLAADNRQALAALSACTHHFCTIVGGPGTGKTTTVTRILAMLMELNTAPHPLRMALSAPTGKAAARLMESIAKARNQLPASEEIKNGIPANASTLHRLLKVRPDGKGFRHHRDNPLALDLLLIDEVSMVDIQLMRSVLDALPPHCRLILLGDSDQLASVEAGNVLDDICRHRESFGLSDHFMTFAESLGLRPTLGTAHNPPPLTDRVIRLTQSYRFTADSGIGHLARSVNEGRADDAVSILLDQQWPDVHWQTLPPGEPVPVAVLKPALEAYHEYLQSGTVIEALKAFDRYRILCATREGYYGVETLNQLLEQHLQRKGSIPRNVTGAQSHYRGRPVMVTHNDYRTQLFNGDIGLIWPDEQDRLKAWFTDDQGEVRSVPLYRLPRHETVYAMTIHKSQGSEFEHCTVLMPDPEQSLLTRELLYTGITRAKKQVSLWGNKASLRAAVHRKTNRMSGLAERLWGKAVIAGASSTILPPTSSSGDKTDKSGSSGEQLNLW